MATTTTGKPPGKVRRAASWTWDKAKTGASYVPIVPSAMKSARKDKKKEEARALLDKKDVEKAQKKREKEMRNAGMKPDEIKARLEAEAAPKPGSAETNTEGTGSAARQVTKPGESRGVIGEAVGYTNTVLANALTRGHDLVLGPENVEIDLLKALSSPEFLEVIKTGKRTRVVDEKKYEVNLKTQIEQHDPSWEEKRKELRERLAEKLEKQDFSQGISIDELDFIYYAIGGERYFPDTGDKKIEVWPSNEDGPLSPPDAFFKFLLTVAKKHDLGNNKPEEPQVTQVAAGNFIASVLKYFSSHSSLIEDHDTRVGHYCGNFPKPGLFDEGLVYDYLKTRVSDVLKVFFGDFETTCKAVLGGGKNEILAPYNVPGLGYSEEEAAMKFNDLSNDLGLQLTSAENDDSTKSALEFLKSVESSALSQEQVALIEKLKKEMSATGKPSVIAALSEELLSEAVVKLDEVAGEIKTTCETEGQEDDALLALGRFEREFMLTGETLPQQTHELLSELADEIKAKKELFGKDLNVNPRHIDTAIKNRDENISRIISDVRASAAGTEFKDEVETILVSVEVQCSGKRSVQHDQALKAISSFSSKYSQRAMDKSRAASVLELKKAIEKRKDILLDIASGKSVEMLRAEVAENDEKLNMIVERSDLSDDLKAAIKRECAIAGSEKEAKEKLDAIVVKISVSDEAKHALSVIKQILIYRVELPEREKEVKAILEYGREESNTRIAGIASSLQLASVRKELGKTMNEVRSLCSRENYEEAGKVLSEFETRMRFPLKFAADRTLDKHMKNPELTRKYELAPFAWLHGYNVYRGTIEEVKEMLDKGKPRSVKGAKIKAWTFIKTIGDGLDKIFIQYLYKYLYKKPVLRLAHIWGWIKERWWNYPKKLWQAFKEDRIKWHSLIYRGLLFLPWREKARRKYPDFEKTIQSLDTHRRNTYLGGLWLGSSALLTLYSIANGYGWAMNKPEYIQSPSYVFEPIWPSSKGKWREGWSKQQWNPRNWYYIWSKGDLQIKPPVALLPTELAKMDDYGLYTLYRLGPVPPRNNSKEEQKRYAQEKKGFEEMYTWLREKNIESREHKTYEIPGVLTYLEEVRVGREFNFKTKMAGTTVTGVIVERKPQTLEQAAIAFVLRKERTNDFLNELQSKNKGISLDALRARTVEWYEKGYLQRHRDEMYANTCGITNQEQLDFMVANPVFAGQIVNWSRLGEDLYNLTPKSSVTMVNHIMQNLAEKLEMDASVVSKMNFESGETGTTLLRKFGVDEKKWEGIRLAKVLDAYIATRPEERDRDQLLKDIGNEEAADFKKVGETKYLTKYRAQKMAALKTYVLGAFVETGKKNGWLVEKRTEFELKQKEKGRNEVKKDFKLQSTEEVEFIRTNEAAMALLGKLRELNPFFDLSSDPKKVELFVRVMKKQVDAAVDAYDLSKNGRFVAWSKEKGYIVQREKSETKPKNEWVAALEKNQELKNLISKNGKLEQLLETMKNNPEYELSSDPKLVEEFVRKVAASSDAAVADFDPYKRGRFVTWSMRSGFFTDKMTAKKEGEQKYADEVEKMMKSVNERLGKLPEEIGRLEADIKGHEEKQKENEVMLGIALDQIKKGKNLGENSSARDRFKAEKDRLHNELEGYFRMDGKNKIKVEGMREDLKKLQKEKKVLEEQMAKAKKGEKVETPTEDAKPGKKGAKRVRPGRKPPAAKPPAAKPGAAKPPAAKPAPKPAQPAAKPKQERKIRSDEAF